VRLNRRVGTAESEHADRGDPEEHPLTMLQREWQAWRAAERGAQATKT
jgi:hypothetical protein